MRAYRRSASCIAGGLAGAVRHGFLAAEGAYLCVLDADLQHPPELVSAMLATASEGYDVVIASRCVAGGSANGLASLDRRALSHGARALAKALFPRRLRNISDPLSGFFLVDRRVIEGAELEAEGFKILLEILGRANWASCKEVPYVFEARRSGESKASLEQGPPTCGSSCA